MTPTMIVESPAASALRHSPMLALRRLTVDDDTRVLTLSGRVSSYYLKLLAQEAVMPLLHNRELVNLVQVDRSADA